MRVGVLGPLILDAGSGPIPIRGARLRALLARLVLDAGRAVRPEVLVEALWGAAPPADEANALQTLVSRLRRVLGDPALLTSDATGYRLVATVDIDRFAALARSGHLLLAEGSNTEAAATLREALGVWRGPALADVREAPFTEAETERLERARLAALEDRIDADLAVGGGADLVAELESLTVDHPLRERMHAQLIRALAAAGRGTEALATYQRLRERLADEFGSDPGPLAQAAHLAVLRGEPAPQHGNLTTPLTSFVGRADDISRVVALLARTRLVTLVGPGGAGKTRLATTAGRELTAAGGVWIVALAPAGPQEVPEAVLDVVRAREAGRPATPPPVDPVDRIVELLAGEDVVVVLDNCEHVVDAAAALAETLLGRCPRLRVLATSREPLRIGGEHLHHVLPLELPEPGSTAGQARDRAAIRLFAERAGAVRPDFTLDGAALDSAIEICRRLDGMPLAIELAAARLRALSIEVVAARLDDRFRLLTGGSRTALPRHRTLHAVVAWSWDLLSDDERLLLERLSVVPGSCTEDAAEAIAGFEARELLAALVDKSLLQPVGAGEPRYRMLETIREYGLAQLVRRAEVDTVRARHAAFFLELAEAADRHLRTRDQLPWLARLVVERDNLLAALRWTIERGDGTAATRFGAALCWFWSLQGDPPETVDLLGRVLTVEGPAEPQRRALVVAAHALGVAARGGSDEVEAAFGRIAPAITGVDAGGHPLLEQARMAAAIASPDTVPDPFPDDPDVRADPWSRASGLLFRGQLARYRGDVAAATELLSRALTGFEQLGERWGTATALSTLEPVLRLGGDLDGVRGMHERATRCFRELGMEEFSVENEVGAALVRAEAGDVDGARRRLESLLDQVAPAGSAELSAQVRLGLAQLEWWAGRPGPAREHGRAGLDGATPPHFAALLLGVLAQADAADGRPDVAASRLDHPAVRLMLSWDTPIGAGIAVATAGIELSRGRPGSAGRLLGVATTLRGAGDLGDVDARRIAEQAKRLLGAAGFAAAHAAGSALSRTDAKELVASIVTAGQRS